MAWETSTRRDRLPPNWGTLRRLISAQADGRCQAQEHAPTCTGIGHDLDHITPGDNHSPTNLAWLHRDCHKLKTSRETAARNKARGRKRSEERHPGLL